MEVDLQYPAELHDSHNDYPLAPERMKIAETMVSQYAKSFRIRGHSDEKLVPNLYDKSHYVLHFRNLKLYTSLGLRVTNIHRVLEFTQSCWLKPYVDLCTANRQKAETEFEKDLWKLYVNAVYGKSMENLRNRVNVRLIADADKQAKLVAKPTFLNVKIINEDLTMVQMLKKKLTLSKPIYTGFTILDISKTVMYQFHYEHIVSRYGERAKLLFTDTDSLCYCIETEDLFADMLKDRDVYDTSNFPAKHDLESQTNKKVLGKFKSETGARQPSEFVGLRPKMYSLLISKNEKAKITAKGVKRGFVAKHVRHTHFWIPCDQNCQPGQNFELFGQPTTLYKPYKLINCACLHMTTSVIYTKTAVAVGHMGTGELVLVNN